jgi:hypothetical protein
MTFEQCITKFPDEWFTRFHAEFVTPEFWIWWVNYYTLPDEYLDHQEFWVRCAFALAGWRYSLPTK